MKEPRQEVFIPRIFKQTANNCGVYSTCGLLELLYKQKGKVIKLDPEKFYKQLQATGKSISNIKHVLEFAKTKGYYDRKSRKYVKIKDYKKVMNPWKEVQRGNPVILLVDLERGKTFRQRTKPTGELMPRMSGFHGIIGLEVSGINMWYANSHGTNYGKNGYGYYKLWMTKKFIRGSYKITI